MSRQQIFYTKRYLRIEKAIVKLLNGQPDFLSARTASSPRAIGDAIQAILSDSFQTLLGDLCREYSADFARRAMADLAFTDAGRVSGVGLSYHRGVGMGADSNRQRQQSTPRSRLLTQTVDAGTV